MDKKYLIFVLSLFILLPICLSTSVNAGGGSAGVGVLNVPPSYMNVTLDQQYDNLRLYLNLSDYNSWEDIYEVKVILEYYGLAMATFYFKQYEDRTSYVNLSHIYTIDQDRIQKKIGVISKADMAHVERAIKISLGIERHSE